MLIEICYYFFFFKHTTTIDPCLLLELRSSIVQSYVPSSLFRRFITVSVTLSSKIEGGRPQGTCINIECKYNIKKKSNFQMVPNIAFTHYLALYGKIFYKKILKTFTFSVLNFTIFLKVFNNFSVFLLLLLLFVAQKVPRVLKPSKNNYKKLNY